MTLIKLGQFRRNFLDLDQLPTHLRPDEVEQKSMPRGVDHAPFPGTRIGGV
ncbi:hypothetical protein cgR_5000 [Corynebacterium glutamicum R]|uniref:Uncharacterized protein n=1 Tax=Corynebacterium glutamicum (strain R) TaxID=340322 RepID=A0AB72V7G0_CORGB|nr:hypothetical protein cgR_5000 [Corynebacterium glutamicum R]